MTDRQRQGVGGVGRRRFGLQPKDSGDHGGDLRLAGAAVAGDRGLDLAGRLPTASHQEKPMAGKKCGSLVTSFSKKRRENREIVENGAVYHHSAVFSTQLQG